MPTIWARPCSSYFRLFFVLYLVINPVDGKKLVVRVPLQVTTLKVKFRRVLPDKQVSDYLDPIAEGLRAAFFDSDKHGPSVALKCVMDTHAVKLIRGGTGAGAVRANIESTLVDENQPLAHLVVGEMSTNYDA